MSLHPPPTPFSWITRWLSTALTVLACSNTTAITRAAADEPLACKSQIAAATSKAQQLPPSIAARVERAIRNAAALSRFHRSDEALPKLVAIVTLLEGPRGERLEDRARTELTKSVHALRSCLAKRDPAPLASLTIHTFDEDGTADGGAGTPLGEGVFVDVEGIRLGRTGADGTLQAHVPSGTVSIRATEYPSSIGHATVTLSPGETATVSIVLAGSKEPSEDSEMLLDEAPDDILPANGMSLTLPFVQDTDVVSIERIEDIELSDSPDTVGDSLEQFFRVSNGVIHAVDVAAVYGRLAGRSKIGRPLTLTATAIDTEGRSHHGAVSFHVGRFKLTVALAPPPSNPALSVANIPVRVSVMGSDIAMRRISDANGRLEVDALPDATVAFDAHTTSAGIHYYGDATVTMCADRSVTLPMLNVKDLLAGAPTLTLDPGSPACPPVPRR